ncbi:MAG TPA: hypothetical protein PKN11_06020, partial [Anaerolineaceae bacterium]|nr:hypothetical protein [Anaerolineaceae bacterium]
MKQEVNDSDYPSPDNNDQNKEVRSSRALLDQYNVPLPLSIDSTSNIEFRSNYHDSIICGDCETVLKDLPDNSVDLIVTSPPYADQRKSTYGGIHPDKYVDWFMPKGDQMLRVLKPSGSF